MEGGTILVGTKNMEREMVCPKYLPIHFIISFATIAMAWSSLSAQSAGVIPRAYIDFVYIAFRVEVIVPKDSSGICSIDDIKEEFSTLRFYLGKIGAVTIKQSFPGSRWGDTLRVDIAGRVVRGPNLARNFEIHFPKPVLERKVLQDLRRFPEVRKVVSGPVVTAH